MLAASRSACYSPGCCCSSRTAGTWQQPLFSRSIISPTPPSHSGAVSRKVSRSGRRIAHTSISVQPTTAFPSPKSSHVYFWSILALVYLHSSPLRLTVVRHHWPRWQPAQLLSLGYSSHLPGRGGKSNKVRNEIIVQRRRAFKSGHCHRVAASNTFSSAMQQSLKKLSSRVGCTSKTSDVAPRY